MQNKIIKKTKKTLFLLSIKFLISFIEKSRGNKFFGSDKKNKVILKNISKVKINEFLMEK